MDLVTHDIIISNFIEPSFEHPETFNSSFAPPMGHGAASGVG